MQQLGCGFGHSRKQLAHLLRLLPLGGDRQNRLQPLDSLAVVLPAADLLQAAGEPVGSVSSVPPRSTAEFKCETPPAIPRTARL
jgi:hypothetical protein